MTTPFGVPLVPEVKKTTWGSSSPIAAVGDRAVAPQLGHPRPECTTSAGAASSVTAARVSAGRRGSIGAKTAPARAQPTNTSAMSTRHRAVHQHQVAGADAPLGEPGGDRLAGREQLGEREPVVAERRVPSRSGAPVAALRRTSATSSGVVTARRP